MRSLKKLITALLAFVMILTCVGVGAFAADFSDITDQRVAEAVSKLVAHGIITGYEDGTFRPDNQITRAEFAAIVTRMMGVENNLPTDSLTGFSDLDSDASRAWARPYVKAAVDLNIINGFEDGTFRAGEPVTYEQAVKMLVCAVGYEVVARSEYNKAFASNPNITWSQGYINAANKHGITKGVITAQITQPASRGVVAVLTSNSLEVPKLQKNENGDYVLPEEGDQETEGNIKTITGTVTGTFYTGLSDDETGLLEDEITVDANKDEYDGNYTISRECLETIDLDALIGRKVTAYYDNLEGEITKIDITASSSEYIDEGSIDSIDGTVIRFEKSNGAMASEDMSEYILIVNGKYVDSYNFKDNFKNGRIELFNSIQGRIAKVESYHVFVVNTYDRENGKFFMKYGGKYKNNNYYEFAAKDSEKPEIYVKSSGSSKYSKTSFDSVSFSAYDVINYLESPDGTDGNRVRKMYVTTGSKSGKVTSSYDEPRKKELDGNVMYLTQQYAAFGGNTTDPKAPFEVSDKYTYYLDYTGQIAAINYTPTNSTGNWEYGYLVEVDSRTEQVGIVTKSGSYVAYTLRSTVDVDGTPTPSENVFSALSSSSTTANAAIKSILTETTTGGYAQPVRYSVSGGKIDAIDTVATGGNGGFTYNGVVSGKASSSQNRVTSGGQNFVVSPSTVVIYAPTDRLKTDKYVGTNPSTAFKVAGSNYVDVFAVDSSTKTAGMVVVYGDNPLHKFLGSSPYMIVTKIISGGEKLEGYVKGKSSTDTVNVSKDDFETDIDSNTNLVAVADVGEGDIIRYITDASGEIIAIEMVYDASDKAKLLLAGTANTHKDEDGSAIDIRIGTVDMKSNNTITLDYSSSTRTYTTGSTTVFKLSNGVPVTTTIDEVYADDDMGYSEVIVISDSVANSETKANVIYVVK